MDRNFFIMLACFGFLGMVMAMLGGASLNQVSMMVGNTVITLGLAAALGFGAWHAAEWYRRQGDRAPPADPAAPGDTAPHLKPHQRFPGDAIRQKEPPRKYMTDKEQAEFIKMFVIGVVLLMLLLLSFSR